MSKEVVNGFELSKIKLLKGGGASVSYSQCLVDGSITHIEKINKISPKTPHPDLTKIIEGMAKFVGRSHGMFPRLTLEKMSKAATAKVQEAIKNVLPNLVSLENEIINSIRVTGLSISGDPENKAVVITAVNEYNNQAVALNTSLIRLEGEKFGFEHELYDMIQKLDEEVYAYLFKGKAAQLEMDFTEEEQKEAV